MRGEGGVAGEGRVVGVPKSCWYTKELLVYQSFIPTQT